MIDELIIKTDAKECLAQHGRQQYANRIRTDNGVQQMLESLNDYVQSHLSHSSDSSGKLSDSVPLTSQDAADSSDKTKVQVQMSISLIRTLRAMRSAQRDASQLVEEVLWESQAIRDAARLKGIPVPDHSESPAA